MSLALVAAGCGSAKARPPEHRATVTVSSSRPSGTTGAGVIIAIAGRRLTLQNVKTGTLVRCKYGAGANLPPPGGEVTGSSDYVPVKAEKKPSSGGGIRLRHLRNGSVSVVCTRPH